MRTNRNTRPSVAKVKFLSISINFILFLLVSTILLLVSIPCLAGVSTYTYVSGAGTNKWAYEHLSQSNRPPTTGPAITSETEFFSSSYTYISSSNDINYISTGVTNGKYSLQHFKFTIAEATPTITNIYVEWEGQGTNKGGTNAAYLYIWNYGGAAAAWEAVGNHTSGTDQVISKNLTGAVTNYIDASGFLHLLAEGPPASNPSGAWGYIRTDFLQVIITSTSVGGDSTPPTTISTLSGLPGAEPGCIELKWNAPGDDGDTGPLTGTYKIMYSTWTDVAWSTASALISISTVSVNPGISQTYVASALDDGVTYYFRIWTCDDANNWSPISYGATTYATAEGFTSGPPNNLVANKFIVTATGENSLSSDKRGMSWRFNAQSSKTLKQVRVFVNSLTGSPKYKVSVQSDDGTANHYPTNNLAWAGATSGDLTPAATGWWKVALNTPGAVTQGTVYHIVVSSGSTAPDNSNKAGFIYTDPVNTDWINQISSNSGRGVCYYNSGWGAQSHEPVYMLKYTDNQCEGNPYSEFRDITIAGRATMPEKRLL